MRNPPRFVFQFDPRKAAANLRKHKVSFREAMTVFDDPLSSTLNRSAFAGRGQVDYSGMSNAGRLLFVVYTEHGSTIRLIGARLATRAERMQYEEIA